MDKRFPNYCIETHNAEAHYWNQNLAEHRGGDLKAAVMKCLHLSNAPLRYWCYCAEFVCFARQHLAQSGIGWRTPHEMLFGETSDISVFRFTFWEPIWYYDRNLKFPDAKMLPGHFLGIAYHTGNDFCYYVIPSSEENKKHRVTILAWSVIRKH